MKNCCPTEQNPKLFRRARRNRKRGGRRGKADYRFLLVGNPNVGKSAMFNQLTGLGVITANYPGTTVEIQKGFTEFKDRRIEIIDIPGTYAIGGVSEDQWVARQAILEQNPDCLIVIADATNLQRNLFLVLQLIDLGLPVVLALNLIDVAESRKIKTDKKIIEQLIGTPVVPTVAIQGKGLDHLIEAAIKTSSSKRVYRYGNDLEEQIANLKKAVSSYKKLPYGLKPEALAFLLMEGDAHFLGSLKALEKKSEITNTLEKAKKEVARSHGQPLSMRLALERHGLSGSISSTAQSQEEVREPISDKFWRLTTHPIAGVPILLLSTTIFFSIVVFSGIWLSEFFNAMWKSSASVAIQSATIFILGKNILSKVLLWGLDDGIAAALSIGVAFILPFYLLLALLEDSGYLNSIAFLSDRVAHRLGLHGRSLISLISAAGCNVPAIMGTRALSSKRERLLASTLITMIPCSARTAVILGTVALFAGWAYTGLLYLLIIAIVFLVGLSLNKVIPGKSRGLVMEMFPLRLPSLKSTLIKTWFRLKGFLSVAFPFIISGSIIMGLLYETGYLETVSKPVSYLTVAWLGLPAITGIVLLAGFLRKEMALELLVVLAAAKYGSSFKSLLNLMTPKQMFIFALVVSLYIPCIATFGVLVKELGWRRAAFISSFTIVLAFLIGGLFNFGFKLL